MPAVLPREILPVAGVLALVLVWPRLRAPIGNGRLALEALGIANLLIAIASLAWALPWWVVQRW